MLAAMDITVTHEPGDTKGQFVIDRDGARLARMTYSVADRRIIINHTEVDAQLRGTGAGAKLVRAAVDWARAEGRQILPLCPYAKSVFEKTPEYADVLAR
jgi:predicted GNAT family acetyltransferase